MINRIRRYDSFYDAKEHDGGSLVPNPFSNQESKKSGLKSALFIIY